jgi:hypothetical protein
MSIKRKINDIRCLPESLSAKRETIHILCIALLGLALGIGAKAIDGHAAFANMGDLLGVWVFTATLVAVFSRTPLLAALNTVVFFLALLGGYYSYTKLVLGFFPRSYFYGWLVVSFLSSIAGFIVWFARGKGWAAVICASLPAALLMAEGYPAFYTYKAALILDLLFAAALLLILPKKWPQKGIALLVSAALSFLMVKLNIVGMFPW